MPGGFLMKFIQLSDAEHSGDKILIHIETTYGGIEKVCQDRGDGFSSIYFKNGNRIDVSESINDIQELLNG